MDAVRRRRSKGGAPISSGNLSDAAPAFRIFLSLYQTPPTDDIELEKFERYALDRLQLLRDIDSAHVRGLTDSDLTNYISSAENKYVPLRDVPAHRLEDVKRDVVSHFILRLAFCKTSQDRKWFLTQERRLLQHRLSFYSVRTFLYDNKINYPRITEEEFKEVEKELNVLYTMRAPKSSSLFNYKSYFKLEFEEALQFVSHRKAFLKSGYVYVHSSDVVQLILNTYRSQLSRSLAVAYQAMPMFMKDERVGGFIDNLSSQYTEGDYQASDRDVSISSIDYLAKRSFPLCMRNLHVNLRKSHHLKHMGRLQYGLFLKGIGLRLDDALIFWKSEFSKTDKGAKFDKEYAYNVRHSYGKEGKRTDYTPYGCLKVISGNVNGPDEHHGCPYKTFDAKNLTSTLKALGVTGPDTIKNIVDTAKREGARVPYPNTACRLFFEATHPHQPKGGPPSRTLMLLCRRCNFELVSHPNRFFDESVAYFERVADNPFGHAAAAASAKPATTSTSQEAAVASATTASS